MSVVTSDGNVILSDGTLVRAVVAVDADGNPASGGSAGGVSVDRELSTALFTANKAFSGASPGDQIARTTVFQVTEPITVVAVIWENLTLGTTITPPAMADLDVLRPDNGLTFAQLSSAGLATAVNQVYQIGILDSMLARTNRFGRYLPLAAEDVGADRYVLKVDVDGWVIRKTTTLANGYEVSYATTVNNPSFGSGYMMAWASKTTLDFSTDIMVF